MGERTCGAETVSGTYWLTAARDGKPLRFVFWSSAGMTKGMAMGEPLPSEEEHPIVDSTGDGVLAAMDELSKKPQLRVVVLKGNGKHFQAGADLKWINAVRPQSPDENEKVSRATFEAVQRLNTLPIPTVALVQGGCFGGGTGIISACDVVIAADNAMFSITEVRWGLTAAIIIPQLCDAIGVRGLLEPQNLSETQSAECADSQEMAAVESVQ